MIVCDDARKGDDRWRVKRKKLESIWPDKTILKTLTIWNVIQEQKFLRVVNEVCLRVMATEVGVSINGCMQRLFLYSHVKFT